MNWLFNEEPTHYGFDALVKDKKSVWSGVKNPLAQNAYADPSDYSGKASVVDVAPVLKLARPVTLGRRLLSRAQSESNRVAD